MTKSEFKQKLEVVRDIKSKSYAATHTDAIQGTIGKNGYKAGVDLLLPLLLDAYEALEQYKYDHRPALALNEGGKIAWPAKEALARIEVFANGEEK